MEVTRRGSYTYTLDMMGDVDEKSRVEIREVGWPKEEVVEAAKGLMKVDVREEGEENRGAAVRRDEVITRGNKSGAAILAG